jgi:DNA-binding transcriptional LysR family regulator
LTEAGARFIAGVEPALADIGKAVEGLTAERGQVTGLLRNEAPRGVLDTLLNVLLDEPSNSDAGVEALSNNISGKCAGSDLDR